MYTKLDIEPLLTFPKGGEVFNTIATSMTFLIRQDRELYAAYLALSKEKGFNPETDLRYYAENCLANSVFETSKEGDTVYAPYSLSAGMFAARVNLLGLPNIREVVIGAVAATLKVRSHFYVMDGQLCGAVELVGDPDTVNANNRTVREVLRLYGFGDIETMDTATDEGNGLVSVATLASRTLPR